MDDRGNWTQAKEDSSFQAREKHLKIRGREVNTLKAINKVDSVRMDVSGMGAIDGELAVLSEVLRTSHVSSHLTLPIPLGGVEYNHSQCMDENGEAQRGYVTCPKSHSWSVAEVGFEHSLDWKSMLLITMLHLKESS